MRISLIGHVVDCADEGVRTIAVNLAQSLRIRHDVQLLDVYDPITWQCLRQFDPDIMHFVLSPTSVGLIVAKVLSHSRRRARTVVSAPHPSEGVFSQWTRLLRPNLILAQAADSEQRFRQGGHHTRFLPNGVDTDRFVPVSQEMKKCLRGQYSVKDQFVLLHVGPIKRGRNVQMLGRLQGNNRQVIIVGRPSNPAEQDVLKELRMKGCIVWSDFFERIEEVYALSDCYLFPTQDRRSCIETPLSVLEAMACNLPVVSTPFGALPRIADEGQGLVYRRTPEAFEEAVAGIESDATANTRHKVLPLSWTNLSRQLETIYERLLE